MAIDADLNAGNIDERVARGRREQLAREAEFYGSMDGAARFSQRDAVATILITAINIIAGFLIGVFQLNIPLGEAAKTYTVLTVGDGLVTMIPSLLVSVAGGIVVTRTSSGETIGADLGNQLLTKKMPLRIAAGLMLLMALIPGLPKFSFFLVAALTAYLAYRAKSGLAGEPTAAEVVDEKKKPEAQQQIETLLKLDEISLEVGYALVPLVDQGQGGQLLQRIRALRRHLALQLGFLVPSIHITDNLKLKPREYVILLRGVEIARWEMQQDRMLAISSEPVAPPLEGIATNEPAFGASATWIVPGLQEQALASGYAVVDQTSVLATHIAEMVRQYAYELLTRQETKRLLDALAETHPKLVEELVPRLLTLGEVEKVLQQLLREQVSIRDLATILEALVDTAGINKIRSRWSKPLARLWVARSFSRCWATTANSKCSRSIPPSSKPFSANSNRKRAALLSPQLPSLPCARFSRACKKWSATASRSVPPFSYAVVRCVITCVACSNPLSRASSFFLLRKFPPASRCNRWGRCAEPSNP